MSLRIRLLTVLLLLATACATALAVRPPVAAPEPPFGSLPAEGLAVDFIAWRSADEERSG
jgi:hypothetical protein